jgi:poly-gamma-glutamate synthesis protein (capsule biosynthesis protein)
VVDAALEPVGVAQYAKPSATGGDQVTLLFGGDISLDDLDHAQTQGEGGFFAEVKDYQQADVSMVNLATPLATAATSLTEELHHKTRPEAVDWLAKSGIDIVNLTNSNLMEYGEEGLAQTLTALDRKGVYRVGAGRNAMEARRPEILDVKGKRIAYLSYAMGGKNAAMDTTALQKRAGAKDGAAIKELENFKRSTAFRDRAGLNAQNMPQIVEDLKAIRNQVDWIVVNFRWVNQISSQPNFVQTNLARLAIDQGADLVVGYHPNVIQGAEIYKGKPIAYSLGDFVFKSDQAIANQDSAMLKVALQGDQMRVEFVPVQVRDSRPKTLTGPEAETVLQRLQAASAQFQTPMQSPWCCIGRLRVVYPSRPQPMPAPLVAPL